MAVDRLGRPLRDDPFRGNARVVATSNITLSGLQTIDDVTLDSNDRVLAIGQTTASQNGLYVAKNGAWSRTRDLSTADDFSGPIYVAVEEGTVGRNKTYLFLPSGAVTVGSTSISFTENTPFQSIDGDKGDITVSSSGTVWNIDAGVITDTEVNASAAIAASKLANTPAGNIAATTVQAAINELDAEKVAGPASSTDSHFAQFDGTTGKLLKGGKAAPSGVVVGTTDTQTLSGKTLDAATVTNGLGFGSVTASSNDDLSKHVSLNGFDYGFSITTGRLNYVAPGGGAHCWRVAGADVLNGSATALTTTVAFAVNRSGGTLPSGTFSGQFAQAGGTANIVAIESVAAASALLGRRGNGTYSSLTALANDDVIFSFRAAGSLSGAYQATHLSDIRFIAAEAWAPTAQGSKYSLRLTAVGAAVTQEVHSISGAGEHVMLGSVTAGTWLRPGSYTVATVPSAATAGAGASIHVTNESGGAVNAFSDGTNWRRVTDRAVIS